MTKCCRSGDNSGRAERRRDCVCCRCSFLFHSSLFHRDMSAQGVGRWISDSQSLSERVDCNSLRIVREITGIFLIPSPCPLPRGALTLLQLTIFFGLDPHGLGRGSLHRQQQHEAESVKVSRGRGYSGRLFLERSLAV